MAWVWSPDAGQFQDTETGQLSPVDPTSSPGRPPAAAPSTDVRDYFARYPGLEALVNRLPPVYDPGQATPANIDQWNQISGQIQKLVGVTDQNTLPWGPLGVGSAYQEPMSIITDPWGMGLGFGKGGGGFALPTRILNQGPAAIQQWVQANRPDIAQQVPHGGIGDILGNVFSGAGGAAGILSFLQPELAPFLAPVAIASGLGSGSLAASQGNPLGAILGFGGAALGGLNLAGSAGGGVGQIGETGFEPGLGQAQTFDLATPAANAGATGGIGAGGGGGAGQIGEVGFEPGLTTGPVFGAPLTDVGQIGQAGFEPGLDAARQFDLGGLRPVGAAPSGESAAGTDWLGSLLKALGLGASIGGQQGSPAMSLNLGFDDLGGNLGTPEETPALPNVDLTTTYPLRGLANLAAPEPFTLADPLAGMENWMMLSSLGAGPGF